MWEKIREFLTRRRPVHVYALVGKSGTGKSFKSQMIASRYRINLIIDDGLLIKGTKLLAGKSAKQEGNFITAMKTALFREEEHRSEILKALQSEYYRRILIIGTSEKMVGVIAGRLNLPQPERIFRIEDVSSQDEIEAALRSRYTEGKHVIPVPTIEVTRTSPGIVYDSIQVFLKQFGRRTRQKPYEKTLVKPQFSVPEQQILSGNVFRQMINQCLYDYDSTIKISSLDVQVIDGKYKLQIGLRSPNLIPAPLVPEIKEYIVDALEKYSSVQIIDATVNIDQWSTGTIQDVLERRNAQIEQIQEINIH
ncbi:MAG: hypothetical protein J5785_00370 [Spirochaetales bacterium]|nr:hypothetical protein [Spirochaetales bacterium]